MTDTPRTDALPDYMDATALRAAHAEMERLLVAATRERDKARRTAEFWKGNHLAGNAEIDDLRAEVERLTGCLKRANDQAEEFERRWYLREDEIERLRGALKGIALGDAADVYETMLMAHHALEQEGKG